MTWPSIQDLCLPSGYRPDHPRRSLATQVMAAEQQRRLLTIIQQAQLGLDYQPMLQTQPDLQHLIHQIQTLMPAALTTPQRHLRLNQSLQAPLTVDGAERWMDATVNLGYQRGLPKLIDWSVRRPWPCWADAVKLWVAAEHFHRTERLNLNQLKLVVIALSFTQRPQSLVIRWNHQQHRQTQARIIQQLVNGDPVPAPKEDPELLALLDIRSIPEIAL